MFQKIIARLKALPVGAKIILGLLVIGVLYGAAHQNPHPYPPNGPYGPYNSPSGQNLQDNRSAYAALQAQHTALGQQAMACAQQMQANQANWAAGAMNGQMPVSEPACAQQMPIWVAQMKGLEARMQQMQGGGAGGYSAGSGGGYSNGGYYAGGGAQPNYNHPMDDSYIHDMERNSDRAIDAADRYDRNAIRGTSMYTNADGQQVEMPTENYYNRNEQTGQYVGSDNNTVPNDTSTYTPVTNNDAAPE